MDKHDENEFNKAELQDLDVITKFSPTLRSQLGKILVCLIIGIGAGYLYRHVPAEGYFFDEIIHFKTAMLHWKITYLMIARPLMIISYAAFIALTYIILKQKFTIYTITDYDLQINTGIIFRDEDTTAWVYMRDMEVKKTPLDYLLFTSTVIIYSKQDKTDPELWMRGLSNPNAKAIGNYMRKNSVKNLPQYRMIEEKKKARNKMGKQSDMKNASMEEEFDEDSRR